MKEKVYTMRFTGPGNVELYEEITGINGRPVNILCAIMDSAASARERARALCPDGRRLRLTSTAGAG